MIYPEYWISIRCVTCGEMFESQRVTDPKQAEDYAEPIIYKHRHRESPKLETVVADQFRL